LRHGQEENLTFHTLGCEAFSYIISKKRKKLDKKAKKCIFVGYDSQHRGYKLYSPSYKDVFVSRDVKFNELLEEFSSNEDVDDLEDSSIAPSWLDFDLDKSPQKYDVYYEETFAPMEKMPTMIIILALIPN